MLGHTAASSVRPSPPLYPPWPQISLKTAFLPPPVTQVLLAFTDTFNSDILSVS